MGHFSQTAGIPYFREARLARLVNNGINRVNKAIIGSIRACKLEYGFWTGLTNRVLTGLALLILARI